MKSKKIKKATVSLTKKSALKFSVKENKMNNKNLICNICGDEFPKVANNDKGNNPDPILRSWGCCDWCDGNIVIPARIDRSEDWRKETDEIKDLYVQADKLFSDNNFVGAISIYDGIVTKSNQKYWPYWDMYLTAREIAKVDNNWNSEVEIFYKNTLLFAPKSFKKIFKTAHATYKRNLVEVTSDEQ